MIMEFERTDVNNLPRFAKILDWDPISSTQQKLSVCVLTEESWQFVGTVDDRNAPICGRSTERTTDPSIIWEAVVSECQSHVHYSAPTTRTSVRSSCVYPHFTGGGAKYAVPSVTI